MHTYCVYLTTYRGNKLPPFYIGSTSTDNLKSGYRGSVSSKKYKDIWKSELKNNPHLFKTQIVCTTEKREEATEIECRIQRKLDVVKSPMYINLAVAAKNGCFGMDTRGKNHPQYGKYKSEESRLKMSISKSGKKKPPRTKEHRENLAKSNIGKIQSLEHKMKGAMSRAKTCWLTWPISGTELPDPVKIRREKIKNIEKFCRDNPQYGLRPLTLRRIARKEILRGHTKGFVIEYE